MRWASTENKVVYPIPVSAGTNGTSDFGEKQVCMTTDSVLVNFSAYSSRFQWYVLVGESRGEKPWKTEGKKSQRWILWQAIHLKGSIYWVITQYNWLM